MTEFSLADRPARRATGIVVLVVVLGGLLVAGGTVTHEDAANDFPDEEHVGPAPEKFVGERVTLGGTVVGTDPVVVEVEYGTGETFEVTVRGVDEPVAVGDRLSAFGTLEADAELRAQRTIVREPWELWYMYVVSFLGGLWVLGRTVRYWRFDTDRLAFVPRATGGDRDA